MLLKTSKKISAKHLRLSIRRNGNLFRRHSPPALRSWSWQLFRRGVDVRSRCLYIFTRFSFHPMGSKCVHVASHPPIYCNNSGSGQLLTRIEECTSLLTIYNYVYNSSSCIILVSVSINFLAKVWDQFIDWESDLFGRISVTDGNSCIVFDSFKVDCDTEGDTDLICSTIPSTNRTGCIVHNIVPFLQIFKDTTCNRGQLFFVLQQWQNSYLNRSDPWREF
mmetsp:Transcript_15376/g.38133  ORF Transcript_15376/g.38133 Transcript_15376/m.38133 type:complete len:221 (+) Transcript_15376:1033-1695(+)